MKRLLVSLGLFFAMFSFLRADPLTVGATAPEVSALSDSGAELDLGTVYKENKYTLVFFYPKAFTGGCTKQGCSLRDAYEALTAKGVAVVGVSTDDVETQRKFKEEHHFPFPLLADTDKKVMKAFGQTGIKFASRQAYLVHDGKIVYADHKGSTTHQAEDILDFLAKNGG
jgi:peroxiredoxin Q/BCP